MRKVGLGVLVGVPLLLVGAWTAAWVYAAREADVRMDMWMAAERALGRTWTCPDRHVGGYPFALVVSCAQPTYSGQAGSQRVDAGVAELHAGLSLSHPRRIAVDLRAPFSFRTSDGGTDVKGDWHGLSIELATLPDIRTVALHGTDVVLNGTFAGVAGQGGAAAALTSEFTLSQEQSDPTLDFDVAIKTLAMATLDEFLGGREPIDLALGGRLDRADVTGVRTPEQAMERWRQAGGRVDIDRSSATRAGASVAATGTMRLDDQHRPKGRLDAELTGFEPILARYGISGNVAAVGSLVSSLFGGHAPAKAPPPGAIDLPISFNNGRLGIGPITTDIRLTPLY